MMYATGDDFRQIYVVAKNEITKFVRGKRFTLYVALILIIFALITALPYLVGNDLGSTPGEVLARYVDSISFLVVLAATLFASITIVSEFEERTALILFTRPIKKTSIFLGKIIGCIVLEITMIVAFYAAMAAVVFIVGGAIPAELLISLSMALLFVFAASSIAILISSVMKKGSTCSILTFVLLLMIIPVISFAMGAADIDTWFMLNTASESMATSIPEYVEINNAGLEEYADIFEQLGMNMERFIIQAPDLLKTSATMLAWGIVALVLAWAAFIRREF
jgi:ABC-type transport system involved in multi-copper enzyme maturation, permease component